ncbi:hypothetical protein [Parahaliea mediterranea]|uniref:LbtU family siderophore porin n=1 Tax=Parahaliea mediterranea TaxID=651086 RepID=A0A939IIA2_9GAMM|nr:hypothetical protein [Parahaliea mediterranea]MBN7795031.1 hypothetical protein [Parahaliea mediterranea]
MSAHAAPTLEELAAKLELLASENAQLKQRIAALEEGADTTATQQSGQKDGTTPNLGGYIKLDHDYSYAILDPTTNINRKQELILESKRNGGIDKNSVYLSAAVTPIANYQKSTTESKFGYLMRHPTSSNQRTKTVSEAVLHSAQIALTANLGDWISAYIEMLYDPEQSFGAGTITDVNRNQVQVRRGYVMLGNLDASPFYLSLGKMATPFGLTDTPNPFTASTVWHAFGGLAYGINAGYLNNGLSIKLMGIQGGAQFRAANVPVDGSNVPSKLNNFAADINYRFQVEDDTQWVVGASYLKGSPYCQDYPVVHFESCEEENGAYDAYTQLIGSNWMVQAEYAKTEELWPGTYNPSIPQFDPAKVSSWDVGGRISSEFNGYRVDWSADFSRFESGPGGSPWERQDQWVLGVAGFLTPSTKLFAELIRTEGYVPLNFISGGNVPDGQTHSDADADSNILMLGINAAF